MDVLLDSMTGSQLKDCPRLLVEWAGNGKPKQARQITIILQTIRRESFDLWLELVERLLLAGELHHALLAFDQTSDWQQVKDEAGELGKHLLDGIFVQSQAEQFRAMLERTIDRTQDSLTARLMLTHCYLSEGKRELAIQQLPSILQDSIVNLEIKSWIVDGWKKQEAKISKPPVGPVSPTRPVSPSRPVSRLRYRCPVSKTRPKPNCCGTWLPNGLKIQDR